MSCRVANDALPLTRFRSMRRAAAAAGLPPGPTLAARYDLGLVALSYVVASLAAYTAIDLAGRVSEYRLEPRRAAAWLAGGAFAMGAGIWAMHFVAMLAFKLPIPVRY